MATPTDSEERDTTEDEYRDCFRYGHLAYWIDNYGLQLGIKRTLGTSSVTYPIRTRKIGREHKSGETEYLPVIIDFEKDYWQTKAGSDEHYWKLIDSDALLLMERQLDIEITIKSRDEAQREGQMPKSPNPKNRNT